MFEEILADWLGDMVPLLLNLAEGLLSFVTFALIVTGVMKLRKKEDIVGANHMLVAVAGLVVTMLGYLGYAVALGDEANAIVEAAIGVVASLFIVVGAYGFLKLCASLAHRG